MTDDLRKGVLFETKEKLEDSSLRELDYLTGDPVALSASEETDSQPRFSSLFEFWTVLIWTCYT